jgi:hypothetical protein
MDTKISGKRYFTLFLLVSKKNIRILM